MEVQFKKLRKTRKELRRNHYKINHKIIIMRKKLNGKRVFVWKKRLQNNY